MDLHQASAAEPVVDTKRLRAMREGRRQVSQVPSHGWVTGVCWQCRPHRSGLPRKNKMGLQLHFLKTFEVKMQNPGYGSKAVYV